MRHEKEKSSNPDDPTSNLGQADVSQGLFGEATEAQWLVTPSDIQYFNGYINPTADTDWIIQNDLGKARTEESAREKDISITAKLNPDHGAFTDKQRPVEKVQSHEIGSALRYSTSPAETRPNEDGKKDPQFELFETLADVVANEAYPKDPHKKHDRGGSRQCVFSATEDSDIQWLDAANATRIEDPYLEKISHSSSRKSLNKTNDETETRIIDYFLLHSVVDVSVENCGEGNTADKDQMIWHKSLNYAAEFAAKLGWSVGDIFCIAEILFATKCHHKTKEAMNELLFEYDATPQEIRLIKQIRISWQHGSFTRVLGSRLWGDRGWDSLPWKDCLRLVRVLNADSYEEADFFMQEWLAIWDCSYSVQCSFGEFRVFVKYIIDELEDNSETTCYGLIELFQKRFRA